MPDDTNSKRKTTVDDTAKSPAGAASPAGSAKAKEQEPSASSRAQEDKLMAEIVSTSEAMDAEALDRLKKEAPDIKRAQPRAELAPDVEDAGVKVPEEEADKVVKQGTTLSLPVSEASYNKGLSTKVGGRVVGVAFDKVVVGVSGLSALALWVARLLKMAHKHAMKIVFRGGNRAD